MAKFTGPKGKLVRRFGVNIYGNPKYDRLLERRSHGPGQHGPNQARRKVSDYGQQLVEKQKLRHTYGLLEKQFRRTFRKAQQMRGVTGDNLLSLLETRLDSIAFRVGFGCTLMQARQLVNHGHLKVNGRRVDIASFRVRVGDLITVRDSSTSRELASRYLVENPRFDGAEWLTIDRKELSVMVNRLPQRDEIQAAANEQMIVELYSK
ncbi:MAG: 30S ribosomal protein S4 [Deltaproteobacteria bacterium]|jgi:small subunit ribosomal protein S4|nr:30S ribosomal protein S4 [Deltaproteobacteria bacterium]MBW2511544.1 30S ribosomal protein S4 [Deltaproteobacteria bacterium]MDH4007992.1 30S ribosomal protein S4 [Desulfuromonadales bacterium]